MPTAPLPDGQLHYQLDGPDDAPVLVLSNSLGTDLRMWSPQVERFAAHFRVLRYDTRGHGASLVTDGPYTIEQNARDLLALLDHLKLDAVSFCGLSMGGLIGQWLAIHQPNRLRRLVLCNTAAKIGSPDTWNPRIDGVLRDGAAGMRALREGTLARWFTPAFVSANADVVEPIVETLQATSPVGYAANCAAVRDADFLGSLKPGNVPCLVVCGLHDPVTTPADGRILAARIGASRVIDLEAAHLSNVEASEAFTREVLAFLLGN